MANNKGGNQNQGGGQNKANQGSDKLSRGEILVAGIMGQFAQTLGMQIDISQLPGYAGIMKLAKGNPQLAFNSAATFFSTLLKLDDVQREMLEGVFRALGVKAAATANASETEQSTEVSQAFSALAEVKTLKTLSEAGLLSKQEAVPYMDALTRLTDLQRRAVAGVAARIKDFDPTKVTFTPRTIKGVALTIVDRNPQTPGQLDQLANELKLLFVPPKGKVEDAATDFIKAADRIKAALAKVTATPGANGHTFMDQVGGNSAARRTGASVAEEAMAQLLKQKGFKR